jgi:hypothetical protein
MNRAIVYNYLRFRCCCCAKYERVEVNIPTLAEHYPYLGLAAVRHAIAALTEGHRGNGAAGPAHVAAWLAAFLVFAERSCDRATSFGGY